MKKITGVSARETAEGKCVSYTWRELDDQGNITSPQQVGSFIALDEDVLAAIALLEQDAAAHLVT